MPVVVRGKCAIYVHLCTNSNFYRLIACPVRPGPMHHYIYIYTFRPARRLTEARVSRIHLSNKHICTYRSYTIKTLHSMKDSDCKAQIQTFHYPCTVAISIDICD